MSKRRSKWKEEAARIISEVVNNLPPGTTYKSAVRAIRDAYPWGERIGHPYACWRKVAWEFEERLRNTRWQVCVSFRGWRNLVGSKAFASALVECHWCHGVGLCIACCDLRGRWEALWAGRDLASVLAAAEADPVDAAMLADWLDERGWPDEAAWARSLKHK